MHALRRVSAFFGAAAPLGCAVLLCICKTDKICCNRFYTMVGATWLDMKYIEQFMYETFETPRYLRGQIEISYVPYTAEWQVSRKSMVRYNDVAAFTTYGTDRASAYRLLEDALNLRDIRIYDTIEDADGRERRVLNAKETALAAQKQQLTKRTVIFVTPCFVCRLLLHYAGQSCQSKPTPSAHSFPVLVHVIQDLTAVLRHQNQVLHPDAELAGQVHARARWRKSCRAWPGCGWRS